MYSVLEIHRNKDMKVKPQWITDDDDDDDDDDGCNVSSLPFTTER